MTRMFPIIYLLALFSCHTYAYTVRCYGGSMSTVTIPNSSSLDQITAGLANDTTSYRKLYSFNYLRFGATNSQCFVTDSGKSTTLEWVAFVNTETAPLTYDGNIIIPTSESGIGLSFNDMTFGSEKAINNISSPTILGSWSVNNTQTLNSKNLNVKITVWKIPGKLTSQSINFNPIALHLGLKAKSSDTFYSGMNMAGSPAYSSQNIWSSVQGLLSGSISLNPGTCDIANKTVTLGNHQGNRPSPWQDASLTINCPTAWGYGMTANIGSSNTITSRTANTPNSGISITVEPRTEIISSIPGTISLQDEGATGYGIQLAWGEVSTLSTSASAPASAIVFNVPTVVSNETFGLGTTPTAMIVNMAARYVPNGETQTPGPANSAIEVIANYN